MIPGKPRADRRPWTLALCALAAAVTGSGCGKSRIEGRGDSPDPTRAGAGGQTGSGPAVPGLPAPGATGGAPGGAVSPQPPGAGDACAEEAITAATLPLDLLLVLDASGSMNTEIDGKTRWLRVSEAIGRFVADPRSAGLGIGLQVFPFTIEGKPCQNDADCGQGSANTSMFCGQPHVCMAPGISPAEARLCDPADAYCPGATCVGAGVCAVTGERCLPLGQPCPGGMAGNLCGQAPPVCKLPIDSCDPGDYEAPRIPLAELPGSAVTVTQGLGDIRPGGNTPAGPAVEGAIRHLRAHLADHPERRAALVLGTDAAPNLCADDEVGALATAIEAARAGAPSLPTYVIGVIGRGDAIRRAVADRLAAAGGTQSAYVLDDQAQDLGDRFLETLQAIRGQALPCAFSIPQPTGGTLDYGKVNVRYTSPTGPDDLVYVGSADRCDPTKGGWYYDTNPTMGTPTRVLLCPEVCNRVKADPQGAIELRFGCRSRTID